MNQFSNKLYLDLWKNQKDFKAQEVSVPRLWKKRKHLFHHHQKEEHLKNEMLLLPNSGGIMIEQIYLLK